MQADTRSTTAALSVGETAGRERKVFAAVALVLAAVFLAYWPTTVSMVETWLRSETYKHCFLVVPAVLWFVWQSRAELAVAPVEPWWPALVPLAGMGALWLTGELASALAPTQWAMVLMVPLAILALFGVAWGRILAFPLAFLLFAVPFGEALTPTLIDWTADFTVAALRAVGIPVLREGPHFVIPSGRWSVVEACSGIRYLMASVVVGTLYAWSVYRSPLRRALFIAASFVVPIVANWLRAFLIVLIGHLSGNRLAVGIDHFFYGWLFFGIVIALTFWVGLRWREDGTETGVAPRAVIAPTARLRPSAAMLVAIVAVVAVWPLGVFALLGMTDKRPLQPAAVQPAAGWTQESQPIGQWTPKLQGTPPTQTLTFARNGARVTLFLAWYRDQHQDHELVNAMNRLVPERDRAVQVARGGLSAHFGDRSATVRTATVRHDAQRLRIWHWYWIDDRIETSDTRAKLSLALDRLLARSDTSAWVAAFVDAETDGQGDQVLSAFAREMGPSLSAALAATSAR